MSEFRDLRSLNLNLLPVLRELLRHASVTEAARSLSLAQSSVSGSLKLLREHFGDELLTTVGRQTVLTSRAKELVEPVERALEAAQHVLFLKEFDPERANVRFLVVAADYVGTVLSPGFARLLQGQYPGITLQVVQGSPEALFDDLLDGRIDLVVSASSVTEQLAKHLGQSSEQLARQGLWTDRSVGIVREGLELPRDLDEYVARPHVTVEVGPSFSGNPEEAVLERLDRTRNHRVVVPNFHLLPFTVVTSDCLACMPESLARCVVEHLPLVLFDLPFDSPPIEIEMVWMPRDTASPRHRWLRQTVTRVVAEADLLRA